MKKITKTSLAALVLTAALAAAGTTPVAAQSSCLDNRQVQAAISSGEIQPLANILAMAGVDSSADVLSAKVCDRGGALYYIVAVLDSQGATKNLVLNAVDGSQ